MPDDGAREAALTRKVELQAALEGSIKELEDRVEELKKKHRELSWEVIPTLMQELDIHSFRIKGLGTVELKVKTKASIPAEPARRVASLSWVRDVSPDLIKTRITVDLPKGDVRNTRYIGVFLSERNIPYDLTETVHEASLTKLVRTRRESGLTVCTDLNLFEQEMSIIKLEGASNGSKKRKKSAKGKE